MTGLFPDMGSIQRDINILDAQVQKLNGRINELNTYIDNCKSNIGTLSNKFQQLELTISLLCEKIDKLR